MERESKFFHLRISRKIGDSYYTFEFPVEIDPHVPEEDGLLEAVERAKMYAKKIYEMLIPLDEELGADSLRNLIEE